jgi:ferredoxin
MPVKTTRADKNAKIIIDYSRCAACGLCTRVCKDESLVIKDGRLVVNGSPLFGCFGCGQCAAVCPNEAIQIKGRALSPADFIRLPPKESLANHEQLHSLMLSRRSMRDFKDKDVEQAVIDRIISSASAAPMGIPPSDVGVLVLRGRKRVRGFSFDFIDYVKGTRWFLSPFMLSLMRPFMSKESHEMFRSFVIPMVNHLVEKREKGEDWLLYDAPLAMYFYCTPYSDPADPYIAATYAMLAAESLGLGSCMIGSIAPFLVRGGKKVKKKYGIPQYAKSGIAVIFGYPRFRYHRAIRRTLGRVAYYRK